MRRNLGILMNRKTRLKADPAKVRAWQEKSRKPLKKSKLKAVNVKRTKKKRKSYAQKLAAYRRSETYKIVEARSGGRCENVVQVGGFVPGTAIRTVNANRCCQPAKVHHHKTYARFGGRELPEDMLHLCDSCNGFIESQHPTRRRYLQGANG